MERVVEIEVKYGKACRSSSKVWRKRYRHFFCYFNCTYHTSVICKYNSVVLFSSICTPSTHILQSDSWHRSNTRLTVKRKILFWSRIRVCFSSYIYLCAVHYNTQLIERTMSEFLKFYLFNDNYQFNKN